MKFALEFTLFPIEVFGVGFKRRARIVFMRGYSDHLAELAVQCADATDMLQACAVCVADGHLDMALWAGQDLWVTLDAIALARLPSLLPGVQHRHYPFEALTGDVLHDERVRQSLYRRVTGMAGGMYMLERSVD